MCIGYTLFAFPHDRKRIFALSVLCSTLIIAAITGIFLNLSSFSPFHILSIVVLTTIPIGVYQLLVNDDFQNFNRQVWFNFLGLNLAFVGALYPTRYIGYMMWGHVEELTGMNPSLSFVGFFVILCGALLTVAYLVYKTVRE